jgi:hypothetical protein
MSGAMSVLPAPVSGVLALPPLGSPPVEPLLLEPHAATPSASAAQQATASIGLREITGWVSFVSCREESPSARWSACYGTVADL